jgi:hypothetical protein
MSKYHQDSGQSIAAVLDTHKVQDDPIACHDDLAYVYDL